MVANNGLSKLVILSTALLFFGGANAQQELRDTFFKEADAAKLAAESSGAKLYAPKSYGDGMREYEDADNGLTRGRNIEYVRSNAADATRHFRAALKAAELAKTALAQAIKSRQDGANAKAPELSADLWNQAQQKFARAIQLLERGDLKNAKRREIEATSLYREAELDAIKTAYLSDTRRLLNDAERARVGRYAPSHWVKPSNCSPMPNAS